MNLNKMILTSIVGITAVTGAFADVPDYETVTSKQYTDTKFQTKIPAKSAEFAKGSLVETTANKGQVTQRGIYDGTVTYNSQTHDAYVPTVGAMIAQITANAYTPTPTMTWSTTGTQNDEDATQSYSTIFGDAAHQWPANQEHQMVDSNVLAQGLALKQNKIPAGTNGNLVTYSGTAGTFGTPLSKVTSVAATSTDSQVPTAKAVWTEVDKKQNNVEATGTDYVDSLSYADGSLVETTGTKGTVTERGIATARKTNATTGALENGDWVPTVDMLITEASNAASNAVSGGTANTLANYDVNGALGTGVTIASSADYDNQGQLTNGDEIPNVTALETKQDKKECVEWVKFDSSLPNGYQTYNVETTGAHCWLWDFPSV